MLGHNRFVCNFMMMAVLALSGCASAVFPDFDVESDIVVDDGGRIEVRKVDEKGILVADKENAVYEDEVSEPDVIDWNAKEEVEPAKVEAVEKGDIAPIIVETEESYSADGIDVAEKFDVAKAAEKVDVAEKFDIAKASEENSPAMPTMHYLAEMIYFANGSAEVDSAGRDVLRKLAKTVKENAARVDVFGYSSSRTGNTDPATHKLVNFKVSAERAENVAKLLKKYGVKADMINVQALSDSKPLYLEIMPEGERLNRRVEIYLTY